MELIFLDTETTGFGQCRLIELAYQKGDDEIRILRAKPPIEIEEQASAVHGIYAADLEHLPAFVDLPEYSEIKELFERSICVAHSVPFDRDVLEREGIIPAIWIDTKVAARRLYPNLEKHKLQTLREDLGLKVEGKAHSAGGDVAVMRALFDQMIIDLKAQGWEGDDALAQLAG